MILNAKLPATPACCQCWFLEAIILYSLESILHYMQSLSLLLPDFKPKMSASQEANATSEVNLNEEELAWVLHSLERKMPRGIRRGEN